MTQAPASRARGRLLGSDAVRAVATVWVVIIHAAVWGPQNFAYTDALLIARFSVPAFTVLTGLLLAYRYAGEPLGAEFARRRLARTIVPWFAWIGVYLLFDIFVAQSVQTNALTLWTFLTLGGGHLWYLLLIPQLYVVFAVWPRRRTVTLAIVAIVVQTGLAVWRLFGPFPLPWVETLILEYAFLLFPFWIGYFAVGLAIGQEWRPLPQRARRAILWAGFPLIVASAVILVAVSFSSAPYATFITGTGGFLDPVLPLLVLSVVAWVLVAAPPMLQRIPRLVAPTRTLADYSLGVYIIHPIPLFFLGTWFGKNLTENAVLSLLWFLFIVAGCLLFSLVVARLLVATPLAATVGMTPRPLSLGSRRPRATSPG